MSDPQIDKTATIPARLRAAREAAGLSQGQVAKIMNMHRPTISEMEAGNRRITADELARMADLYDAKVAWLLGEAPDRIESDGGNTSISNSAVIELGASTPSASFSIARTRPWSRARMWPTRSRRPISASAIRLIPSRRARMRLVAVCS